MPSTVKSDDASIGAGKSDPDKATTVEESSDLEKLPIAAKAKATDAKIVDSASAGASAADDAIDSEGIAQAPCDQEATASEPPSEPEPAAPAESVSESEPAVVPEGVSEPEVAQEPVTEASVADSTPADDAAPGASDSAIDEQNDCAESTNEA